MIRTLVVTLIVEGIVGLVYCIWQKKPIVPIFITSVIANLITQSLLWAALRFFFQHYLATLLIAEILIWIIESVLLRLFPANKLDIKESSLLSLMMNLISFGIGWFLPI